ncbi:RtcB family protein [Chondrinema litorale]|uniref:RtcB family protein n=1 Tax=Chondrinema litorale TaxID=2994555 RepID=UPI00254368CB|nr:RtcB family protein [Chondrinema litorale]UZR95675.1 RtcB family protein [Chondrinema litorale]
MAKDKIRGNDLLKLGVPHGRTITMVLDIFQKNFKKDKKEKKLALLSEVMRAPEKYSDDAVFGSFVTELLEPQVYRREIALRSEQLDYAIYGAENIEKGARSQIEIATKLPVAVGAALMADAHHGYGLPIGGVLATENAVIPYGVGVDIGCRMCMTIYNMPENYLERHRSNLKQYLMDHTEFGTGNGFSKPMDDPIFDRPEFDEIKVVRYNKDKAYKQIGSSGSGNHFVEFGEVEITDADNEWGIETGKYLGILSHSGSRALGANIAKHYTQLAMSLCRLPNQAKHLAWLDLNSEAGQEYWLAMNLAGDYASACHHQIHKKLAKALGEKPVAQIENHHNFAWKEKLANGKEVIVHRKGATPAKKGELGIIPGSMVAPGYIVRGKGNAASLNSASHGAGRVMSRSKARETNSKKELRQILKKHEVNLIGGGLDEAPMAYKDIEKVMQAQRDLVDVVGKFQPKIVRMDNA